MAVGLGALVSAVLVTMGSGAIEYFLGVRLPSGAIASACLLIGGLVVLVMKGRRPSVLLTCGLAGGLAIGGCLAVARGVSLEEAVQAIAGFLLVPAVLSIASLSESRESKVALRWLLGMAIVQIPFLIANERGVLTPITDEQVFFSQDRYQGAFLMHGPYLATYLVATALAVLAARTRRVYVAVPSVASILALGYWTENRILFFLVAVGVGAVAGWSRYSDRRTVRSAFWAVPLATIMVAAGAAASTAIPARTWGSWGADNLRVVAGVSESQHASDSELEPIAIQDKASAAREVLKWSGSIWDGDLGVVLTGRGASLGLSHRAQLITAVEPVPSNPYRLLFANPSMSLVIGPASSFLGLLSEFGLVGLGAFALTVGALFRALWMRCRHRELLALLPPYAAMWILTPALESPVLPAILGLGLLAARTVRQERAPGAAVGEVNPPG